MLVSRKMYKALMALKLTINRRCPKCGTQQVFDRDGERISYEPCPWCKIPGPMPGTRSLLKREVIINENDAP